RAPLGMTNFFSLEGTAKAVPLRKNCLSASLPREGFLTSLGTKYRNTSRARAPAPHRSSRRSLKAEFFDFFAEGIFERVYAFAGNGRDGKQLQSLLAAEGSQAIEFALRRGSFSWRGG